MTLGLSVELADGTRVTSTDLSQWQALASKGIEALSIADLDKQRDIARLSHYPSYYVVSGQTELSIGAVRPDGSAIEYRIDPKSGTPIPVPAKSDSARAPAQDIKPGGERTVPRQYKSYYETSVAVAPVDAGIVKVP